MRFFSNDARETTEEQAHDDRPDKVQSDPVAVPNQRPPSPWSTPATDSTDDSGSTYASSTATEDRVDAHDHGGGSTDEVDLPLDDRNTPADTSLDPSVVPDKQESEVLKDDGGFDAPQAVEPGTDRPLDSKVDSDTTPDSDTAPDSDSALADRTDSDSALADRTDSDSASADRAESETLKDDGSFDAPEAVEPGTDKPLETDDSRNEAEPAAEAVPEPATEPVIAAAPVAAAATPKSETIFDADDARGFQERWREVQLRFVDSPKDAAGDAAELVDEAVEKLTSSLRSQREGLTADTEDTEQLRVQLRGYRDILNRILGL